MRDKEIEKIIEKVKRKKYRRETLSLHKLLEGYPKKKRSLIIRELAEERLLGVFKK